MYRTITHKNCTRASIIARIAQIEAQQSCTSSVDEILALELERQDLVDLLQDMC